MAKNKNKTGDRNPKNPLFRQLSKLLSGPLVRYRRQDAKQLKRRQLDKYSLAVFAPRQDKSLKCPPTAMCTACFKQSIMPTKTGMDRYVDFDQMEYTPEIASALDIYADEMTTSSPYSPIININCSNKEIKGVLETLFFNVLNIEFNLFGWCRSMCKYGDFFPIFGY